MHFTKQPIFLYSYKDKMATATPSTPAPNADWKRKLNLDRTNARRASSIDNTEEDTMDAPMPKTNPRFRDLMANVGAPQTKSSNPAPVQDTSPQPEESSPNTDSNEPSSEKPNPLQSASDILAQDKSANGTGSGISTGLEGKEDKPTTPGATPQNDAKAQMSQNSLPMSTPPAERSRENQGKMNAETGKMEKEPGEKEKAKKEKQQMREVIRGKGGSAQMAALKKLASARGKTDVLTQGLKGGKLAGPMKTLKRLTNPPPSITGKIGTVLRIILLFVGGSMMVDIVDEILGEDVSDKMLTFGLLQSIFMNCCAPLMPFLILAGIIGGLIAAFS